MLDSTDWKILQLLKEDSRRQWRDIGHLVHLTGQAVATRIRRMQDEGVIEKFTIALNYEKTGKPLLAFITVFMSSPNHAGFQKFIAGQDTVEEVYRVSGEGCYWIKAQVKDPLELNQLLDGVLAYGNYRVNLSIGKIK